MDGDRRVVTALFADLVDYVRMVAEHDPEEVRARVVAALESMDSAIRRFGGTREKFIGDAIFAVFGWPQAHDEDAIRAALAGLAIRAALRAPDDGGPALEVRIGIATGEVVAAPGDSGQQDAALTGEAVARAARIQSIARPGEILVDGATLAVARHRLHTEDRGDVVLRGQSVPIRIHALTREVGLEAWGPPRSTGRRPLVGRATERATLVRVIEEAAATGRGRVVVVGGDAGIGKSRLVADVEPDARRAGFAWTWTENSSYGSGEPYRFARLMAQALADERGLGSGAFTRQMLFTPDLDPADVRRYGGAIAAIARAAGFDGWEAEARDIPVDPDAVGRTLLEVGGRYIDRIVATGGPRVIVIDDLHWLDDSSVGLVEQLVERTSSLPLIVLAGIRPGQVPAWADGPGIVRIELGGLSEPESAHLATIIAQAAMDAASARRIHERTAGNPFFIRETVRAFLDDGTLRWRHGRVALVEGARWAVPVSLRAIIGVRIDALPADGRDALGVASVIGMQFSASLVRDLVDGAATSMTFEVLAEAALIEQVSEDVWRFAHPLIHEVAHAGMLTPRRRGLHGRVADRLAAIAAPDSLGEIAEHRAASGDAERAVPLLVEAAESALAVGAGREAARYWRAAANLAAHAGEAESYRARALAATGSTGGSRRIGRA